MLQPFLPTRKTRKLEDTVVTCCGSLHFDHVTLLEARTEYDLLREK